MSALSSRQPSSAPISRTHTPPPLPSKDIPKDFRSSLSAWWASSPYNSSRVAEERLLRRLSMYKPSPRSEETRGWFGSAQGSAVSLGEQHPCLDQSEAAKPEATANGSASDSNGLVATLRNVFIPTPNPSDAPLHPADPRVALAEFQPDDPTLPVSGSPEKNHHFRHKICKKTDKNLVDYINTLEITAPENRDAKEAVVVLHGYAAALGFFFRNWESIAHSSAQTNRRTFFLDWLGMGLSSRPSSHLLSSPLNTPIPSRVARAEHFFLSSLEDWRKSIGIEKMVLVGHSLGGYLASAYAVRYPERVSGLVLVSPAGIPHGPEYTPYPLTSQNPSPSQAPPREAAETPSELDEAVDAAEMELGERSKYEPKGEAKQWQGDRDSSLMRRGMMKFFVWGWERGLSPFSILRSIGPWGPLWVGKYSSRRFGAQKEEDVKDLHAYIYGTSVMKGSGEYCISHILAPGAYARIPILDRINQLKIPVTFMYGDNDWMDVQGGYDSAQALLKAGNPRCAVHVVPKAGHHLYLDNPEVSNKLFDEAIKTVPNTS
ncbi:uncharacterized protein L203_102223 [Cryptococcus depauperatus CBS 7841]|uniref:Uncharacterized protein n=1 Tax=Cryptococcus depauperatus CBS 7841 TaxID=1295531 RepID=A0A1E3IRM5_9TREE|nr:cardiolipin-specific phospholipase [Cryptococcus depauperatus CBS 7841]